ncbi:MAG: hypothetical protein GXO19_06855 [Epsilonproteobacteria bacterium]|nr:hypothetical protein [Campylobacterota bacterium]NPA57435.1 hypothetical protein [Campylobacterota bacterium]
MRPIDLDLNTFPEKKAIVQKLRSMGMPTPKTEHYRYFGIRPILEREYTLRLPERVPVEASDSIEIVDGVVTKAPEGLFIEYLPQVRVDDSHYDQVYYINHLLTPMVVSIELEESGELRIVHKFTQNNTFTPYRLKISVSPKQKVKILEETVVVSESSLYFYGYDMEIGEESRVTFISSRITHIHQFALFGSHSISVGKGGEFHLYTFDLGSGRTIHNYHTILHEKALNDNNHILFSKGEGRLGNTFHIEHRGKESKSLQLSRNILKDRGRGIFDGLLIVKNPAKYSSIFQDSRTILLNSGPFMVSKPQMEIHTEFITEATHGSTTGHLDGEALFYLRQRGISLEEAKEMLVLSFLDEIFQKLGDEEFRREFITIYEENR